jgi:ankyrin repeat protein
MKQLFSTISLVSTFITAHIIFASETNNGALLPPRTLNDSLQQEFYTFIDNITSGRATFASEIISDKIKSLVSSGIDINAIYSNLPSYYFDPTSRTMLQQVLLTDAKNYRLIEALIRNGAQVNAQNNDGQNALHFAVKYADHKVVEYLCKQPNTNINAIDNKGMTPLATCAIDIDRFFYYGLGIDNNSIRMSYGEFIAIPTILLRYSAHIENPQKCELSSINAIRKVIATVKKNPFSALSPEIVKHYKKYNTELISLLLTKQKERSSHAIQHQTRASLNPKDPYVYIMPKQ